jgi:hypothetical protein
MRNALLILAALLARAACASAPRSPFETCADDPVRYEAAARRFRLAVRRA